MSVSEESTASAATVPIPPRVPQRGPKIAVIGPAKAGRALPKTNEGASSEVAGGHDPYAVTALADIVDRSLHAAASRFTMGLSPAALTEAYLDWATHLTFSPGRHFLLINKAIRKAARLSNYTRRCALEGGEAESCVEPLPQDRRFVGDDWQKWPYNLMYQGFLLNQQWWHNATTGIRGVTKQHENMVEFASRQMLDMFSPSNFLLTNPEIMKRTVS